MGVPTREKVVALVEDDQSLCRALARLLTAGGIRSRCYSSAEAFLEEGPDSAPGCLVLDLQLTGMSGFDLQRELIGRGRFIPTIFITADDSPEAREQATSVGCEGFFLKTDPGHAVLWAVRRVLGAVPAAPCAGVE